MVSLYDLVHVRELTLQESTEPGEEVDLSQFYVWKNLSNREGSMEGRCCCSIRVCQNSETGCSGEAKEDSRLLLVPREGLPHAGLEPDAMLKLLAVTVWWDFRDLQTTKACSDSDFADHCCWVEWEEWSNEILGLFKLGYLRHLAVCKQGDSAVALERCAGRLQSVPTYLTCG